MRKTYKSKMNLNGLLVKANGVDVQIVLEPSIINEFGLWGSAFATEDKDLQKAIERHPLFNGTGRDAIWTDDVEEEVNDEQVLCVRISDLKEAKKWMIENYGVTPESVRTKAMLIAVAKENSISFPNL